MDIRESMNYFAKTCKSPKVTEAIFYIENAKGDFSKVATYGGKTLDTPMLAASITKLFTTSVILILSEEGKLDLGAKISEYLGEDILNNLHVFKKVDYTFTITISNLLKQNTGLPDYYTAGKGSMFHEVMFKDTSYTFSDSLKWTKALPTKFIPGSDKAFYTDMNFDLLGKIIESVTGLSYAQACKLYIFDKLGLTSTFIATREDEPIPYTYYKGRKIQRNKLIASCYASGGAVTTAKELMIFLKAFWLGKLFNRDILALASKSNRLQLSFYPISYGYGYMKIDVGLPFKHKLLFVGHSGSTGSIAFYCKEKDAFFVCDFPEASSPSLCVRFAINALYRLK